MNMLSLKKPHCLKKISNLGFTLVEMLVTISIMLVITGGGIASFINFNDRQNVQVAVKELQTLLRSAQVKAKVGEGARDCRDVYGEVLRGYRVYIADDSNVAVLSMVCAPSTPAVPAKFAAPSDRRYIERSRIDFATTVTAGMLAGGDVDIEFLTLLGGVDGFGEIEVLGSGGYEYNFNVSEGGEISEGDFL